MCKSSCLEFQKWYIRSDQSRTEFPSSTFKTLGKPLLATIGTAQKLGLSGPWLSSNTEAGVDVIVQNERPNLGDESYFRLLWQILCASVTSVVTFMDPSLLPSCCERCFSRDFKCIFAHSCHLSFISFQCWLWWPDCWCFHWDWTRGLCSTIATDRAFTGLEPVTWVGHTCWELWAALSPYSVLFYLSTRTWKWLTLRMDHIRSCSICSTLFSATVPIKASWIIRSLSSTTWRLPAPPHVVVNSSKRNSTWKKRN